MNSTWCRVRIFNISSSAGLEFLAESDQRVYLILQYLKALTRRERQHPADQRQVDAILAVIRVHQSSLLQMCIRN